MIDCQFVKYCYFGDSYRLTCSWKNRQVGKFLVGELLVGKILSWKPPFEVGKTEVSWNDVFEVGKTIRSWKNIDVVGKTDGS